MAVKTNRVSLSVTPAELTGLDTNRSEHEPLAGGGFACSIAIKADVDMYVGGADVTTANGWLVSAGQVSTFDLWSSETLWGVLASSTGTAQVIRTGV